MRIKSIIFDFDGVLVDSIDIKTKAFAKLFEPEGKEVVRRVVSYHLNNAGVSRYEKLRFIYKEILDRPLADYEFQLLCERFSDIVINDVIRAPYVLGAGQFLEAYAKKYRCFIVSATPQEEIKKITKKRDMLHFFKAVYGAPTQKIDAVRDVLIKEKVRPINLLYIGDAMSDYLAAKNNSVNFIAVINNNEAIFKDIDCIKIKNLMDLNRIIEPYDSSSIPPRHSNE